jgi:hypothetical protein
MIDKFQFPFEKMMILADNDQDYLVELKTLYIDFFKNLMEEYPRLLTEQNFKDLRVFLHKIKPAVKYLELNLLENLLNQGILMLKNTNYEISQAENIIKDIIIICQKSLEKLQE